MYRISKHVHRENNTVSQESKRQCWNSRMDMFYSKTINALAMQSNNEFIEAIDSQMGAKMVRERFGVHKTTDLGNIHCLEMVPKLCV